MRTFTLTTEQMDVVLSALRFARGVKGYAEDQDDRDVLDALIEELDPELTKKEGWMVRYGDGSRYVHDSLVKADALARRNNGKIIKVTWEE